MENYLYRGAYIPLMILSGVANWLMVVGPFCKDETVEVFEFVSGGEKVVVCNKCGYKADDFSKVEKHWMKKHVEVPRGSKITGWNVTGIDWEDKDHTIEYVFIDYVFTPSRLQHA